MQSEPERPTEETLNEAYAEVLTKDPVTLYRLKQTLAPSADGEELDMFLKISAHFIKVTYIDQGIEPLEDPHSLVQAFQKYLDSHMTVDDEIDEALTQATYQMFVNEKDLQWVVDVLIGMSGEDNREFILEWLYYAHDLWDWEDLKSKEGHNFLAEVYETWMVLQYN